METPYHIYEERKMGEIFDELYTIRRKYESGNKFERGNQSDSNSGDTGRVLNYVDDSLVDMGWP